MDIRAMAARLHISDVKLVNKALEYQRMLQAKSGSKQAVSEQHKHNRTLVGHKLSGSAQTHSLPSSAAVLCFLPPVLIRLPRLSTPAVLNSLANCKQHRPRTRIICTRQLCPSALRLTPSSLLLLTCPCRCSFHHSVSPAELLRYSGLARASAYAHTLAAVSSILALTPTVTIAALCIRHACPAVATQASHLLATYQQRLAASLPPAQRASLPLSSPPTVLAAFYCTARQQKVKVDMQRLRDDQGIKPDEWRRTLDSYNQHVGKESGMEDEHARQQQRAKRKRQADAAEHDDELVDARELDSEAAAAVPQLAGGRGLRYAEWRERVVEEERKEAEERRVKRERLREEGGEGNEDEECEWGEEEEVGEARKQRAPRQTKLSFSVASGSQKKGGRRKTDGQSKRGGYTDVVVL